MKTITLALVLSTFVSGAALAEDAAPMKTCGQMMAEKAALPAKMVEVMTAVHDMATAHARLMDQAKDKESKKEAAALRKIASDHMALVSAFKKAAGSMKSMETLPGAPHDMTKFHADAKLMDAMKRMLATHKEMVELLNKEIAEMETNMKKPGA